METQINTSNEVKTNFFDGYGMLPAKFQAPVREAIMDKCGITYISFYNRMKGICKINKAEIPIIEKEFAKHNINPWTGERTA